MKSVPKVLSIDNILGSASWSSAAQHKALSGAWREVSPQTLRISGFILGSASWSNAAHYKALSEAWCVKSDQRPCCC